MKVSFLRRAADTAAKTCCGAVLVCLLAASALAADTLTGTVTNATTGKPAAGDDVVLLTLSQGMTESGRTKTDAAGRFTLPLDNTGVPHLVRVTHQGVNYFPAGGPIRPGMTSVLLTVYDVAKKLDGIKTSVHVMRLQAPDTSTLQVIELIALNNESNPPRTLGGDRTWDIYLPEGAKIDTADAAGPGGMPITTMPAPDDKQKGRYYFSFPIRPGETRFQVAYHLPYSGEATLKPHLPAGVQHFAVMLPKSMQFGPQSQGLFAPMTDDTGASNLQVATNVTPDKDLSFRVAGTGEIRDSQAQGGQGSQAQGGEAGGGVGMTNRPGGGLGNPEGTPDPLHQTRWIILGGLLGILVLGGMWAMSRGQRAPAPAVAAPAPARAANGGRLLDALKEELFELEMDRQQGRVSEAEYAKAKAALDQTLQRALSRAKSKKA